MMNTRNIKGWTSLLITTFVLLWPVLAKPIEFDEIRDFGDVFKISATADDRHEIKVSWQIADGFYLYNNKFLKFKTETAGVVLGEAVIPPGKPEFDDLLGENVIKFHKRLDVRLPLESLSPGVDLVSLKVRSQGCMEDVFCYPPTEQLLVVNLPPAAEETAAPAPSHPAATLSEALQPPLGGLGQDTLQEEPALPADQAFKYEAIAYSPETILVRFTAQPGYYLYRDKLAFRVSGGDGIEISAVELPRGTIKDDPEFGPVEVYYDLVEIPVDITRPAGPQQKVSLVADYQGCRDGDICYPPQTSSIDVVLDASAGSAASGQLADSTPKATPTAPVSKPRPVSEQDALARMLLDNPAGALLAFFIAGILLAFTPCVFPMVPILSGIIAGQGDNMTTARAFWLSVVYVLAMAVTYTVAGILAGLFGQNLQAWFQNPWILGVFIAIFVALALSMFGFFELQLPSNLQTRLTQASSRQKGGSLAGVAVMGFLSALIVGPCVAPPLAAALIVIGASGSAWLGGSALFALSIGMGVPLILFGVSAGKLIPRAGPWMDSIKAVFGVALLALAIWMLERIVQGPLILLLWGILATASGVYLGAFEAVPEGASGWRRLWKALGLVLLAVGMLEIVGAASGGDDWSRPLQNLRSGTASGTVHTIELQRVKSADDVAAAVAGANRAGKPAMLDFYADWCVECIRLERNTFGQPNVQELFGQIQPLQADVTENDDIDQALMKKYDVIGPPAILFFDRQGNEMRAYRLVGFYEPEEFSRHLQSVLEAD